MYKDGGRLLPYTDVREGLPVKTGHINRFLGESHEQVMWVFEGRDFQGK